LVKVPNQAKVDWLRREVVPLCVVPRDGERRQKLFERVKIVRISVGNRSISVCEGTVRKSYRE